MSRSAQPRRARPWVLAGVGVLCALIAAGIAWWVVLRVPALEPGWTPTVVVLAGDGSQGFRNGDASRARFSDPFGVAVGPDGSVFVTDAGESHRVRRIDADGIVSTLAGGSRGFADGLGTTARFDTPSGLAVGADGTLYIADTANNAIRRITRHGDVSTLAGDGAPGYRDGPGSQARFNGPVGVALDRTGRVIVADTYNDRIRAIAPDGTVTTLAGSGQPGLLDGRRAQAQFDTPCGVAVDDDGRIYVADTGNDALRIIDTQGLVSRNLPRREDQQQSPTAEMLTFDRPVGIAVSKSGDIYITEEPGRIVEISRNGGARTIAGSTPGFRDGPGGESLFRRPAGIAVNGPGRLVVSDAGNALVRLVAAPSRLGMRAPASPQVRPGFDEETFARLPLLWPVAPMEGPHEVAGTMGEARGDGADRFHSGIDIRVPDGTLVRAVRDGVISEPSSTGAFGTLNEWLRIGSVTYVHMRAGRNRLDEMLDAARYVATYDESGKLARVRTKRGARFMTGEVIGSVNRFNHVHMNVGWPGDERNPLQFRLVQFADTVRPTITRRGVQLYDEHDQPITERSRGRLLVAGRVRIVVDAWDRADGNRPSRRLGLYALGYQVLNADGSPAPGFEGELDTIRFDRLRSDSEAARLIYAKGSGIPFYGRRVTRFLYVVTNTLSGGVASEGFWDSSRLPSGDYTLRIHASDFHGNTATSDLAVTVVAPAPVAGTPGGQ